MLQTSVAFQVSPLCRVVLDIFFPHLGAKTLSRLFLQIGTMNFACLEHQDVFLSPSPVKRFGKEGEGT